MRLKDFNIVYQIARTELRVIFYSPVAWLILVVFAVQCGDLAGDKEPIFRI